MKTRAAERPAQLGCGGAAFFRSAVGFVPAVRFAARSRRAMHCRFIQTPGIHKVTTATSKTNESNHSVSCTTVHVPLQP